MTGDTWGGTWGACWGNTWGAQESSGGGAFRSQPAGPDLARKRLLRDDEEFILLLASFVAAGGIG
jgi:hypothetical protein